MIKKILPLMLFSMPTQADLLPFDFKVEKKHNSNLVEILLENTNQTINVTQLYLKGPNNSFSDIDFYNTYDENYRKFSSSMRVYDSNSDDLINFFIDFKDLNLQELDYGVGFYENSQYNYEKGVVSIKNEREDKVTKINEPFGLGLFSLGLYSLYSQRKQRKSS